MSEQAFGKDPQWTEDPILSAPDSFYPSRLEWLVSGALASLVGANSPHHDNPEHRRKEFEKCVQYAIELAQEVERQLDAAAD